MINRTVNQFLLCVFLMINRIVNRPLLCVFIMINHTMSRRLLSVFLIINRTVIRLAFRHDKQKIEQIIVRLVFFGLEMLKSAKYVDHINTTSPLL